LRSGQRRSFSLGLLKSSLDSFIAVIVNTCGEKEELMSDYIMGYANLKHLPLVMAMPITPELKPL
jgi:hypothetical protein